MYREANGGEWVSSYFVPPGKVRGDKIKIPDEVVTWAELKGPWAGCSGVGVIGFMEDKGMSHAEVADVIQQHWSNL